MIKMLEVDHSIVSIFKIKGEYLIKISLPSGDHLELPVRELLAIKQIKDALKFKMLTVRGRRDD